VEAKVSKKHLHVLVVDDEDAIVEMIRYVLEQADMQASTAANAYEALLCINDNRPDIVLLDWMMPGVSGIELTRRLRKDSATEDIPIIMLTARVTEDDKVSGLEAGADDYLIKPFDPQELKSRITVGERVLRLESELAVERRRRLVPVDDGKLDVGGARGEGFPNDRVHSASRESTSSRLGPGIDALDQPSFGPTHICVGNEDHPTLF